MAEQTPGVKNKKLLLVALGMGILVVLIYNLHIGQVRQAGKGQQVLLVRFRHDLKKGSMLKDNNVKLEPVPAALAEGLGSVVVLKQSKEFGQYRTRALTEDVEMNQYLRIDHLEGTARDAPSNRIEPNKEVFTLVFDPMFSPGEILRPGGRVNILGKFEEFPGKNKYYRIIEAVRVHTVGGKSLSEPVSIGRGSTFSGETARSYRAVGIEVMVDDTLKLARLTEGRMIIVTVLNPKSDLPPNAGRIDPDFEKLAREKGLID